MASLLKQDPGSTGPAEIRLRYAPDGSDLNPEQVISSPSLGATNADLGLFDGGDLSGDTVVSWVQGSGDSTATSSSSSARRTSGLIR